MSFEALAWAGKAKTGSVYAKVCLFVLADHMNDLTRQCYPSIQLLLEETEIRSKNTLRKAIRDLEALGLISRQMIRGNAGEILRTVYTLNVPKSAKFCRSEPAKQDEGGSRHDPGVGHHMTEGGSTVVPGVGHAVVGGGSSRDPEPIKEPITTNTHTTNAHAAVPADSAVDDSQKAIKPKAAKPKKVKQAIECPEGVDKGLFDELNSVRKFKRQPPFTERTWGFFVRSAGDAGLSVDDVLKICVERSWASFRADWLKDSDKRNQPASDPTQDIFK